MRRLRSVYRLTQEYITPYTPEQNGLVERFFRPRKEECVWQHNVPTFLTQFGAFLLVAQRGLEFAEDRWAVFTRGDKPQIG